MRQPRLREGKQPVQGHKAETSPGEATLCRCKTGGPPPWAPSWASHRTATGRWGSHSLLSQTRPRAQGSPENSSQNWFEREEEADFQFVFNFFVLRGSLFLIFYSVHTMFTLFVVDFSPESCPPITKKTKRDRVICIAMVCVFLQLFS